jgi:hypothetical protein
MPEYSAELPLWGVTWQSLDLPASLLDRLADWQQEFDDNFDPFSGWKSEIVRAKWSAEAQELEVDLRRALPKEVELVIDLWPIEPE